MSAPVAEQPSPSPALSEHDLAEVMGAFNDVTSKLHAAHESLRSEVSRLKDELRVANEQLERSRRLAALGEMAAGIAHEVRNPLGSIRLYARMLEQDLADRPSERSVAERIGSAVRGLDAVVMDVLAFAKEMRIRPEPTEVRALIERAIEESLADDASIADPAKSRSQIRVVRPPDDHADELLCDTHLAHRALVNIIRNGIQAMRDDGACQSPTLTVEFSSRHLSDPDGSSRQFRSIAVRDNGPGIPKEVLGRIFNPFFTTRATGTGLGLAIVHRIMDAHAGRVSVRSAGDLESGGSTGARGTIVELLFPTHGEDAPWSMEAQVNIARREGSPALAR